MLHINIICIGKIKETFFKDSINEYSKRLSKYCNLKIIELPDEKVPLKINDKIIAYIKEKECNNIISNLPKDSYIIALDLKGKQYSSEEFANHINDISTNLKSNITFIIGGTLGISSELLNICNEKICFSKMTFPHQLIRIFLLEQLFRSFKILNGETYHR
ncbi:MAG TPA: 23S rRNA (pseudouridine(1915)-N(3))-methyltransferase RlmH [Clostridiales bacterium]|nr:23S rRNA (pseudouridine(1915)-N(3))-methyltransferase RlmH [Clostridiales bacterium]